MIPEDIERRKGREVTGTRYLNLTMEKGQDTGVL